MTERLLRLSEVESQVGLRKSAIYEKIKHGEFPEPIRLGAAVRWPESRIQKFIADLIGKAS